MEYVILGIIIVAVALFVHSHNNLISLKDVMDNFWNNINLLFQQRFDLISNLMTTVKEPLKREEEVLGKIIRSCNTWENSSSTADKVKADQIASGALKALFTVSGSYPELEEDEEFLKLRKELIRLEELIADIRQRYNRAAGVYNTILKRFPNNLLSGPLKLFPRELFPQEDEGLRRPA